MKKTVMFLALILFLFSPAFARIYQVPSTFIATIQGGINVAKDGDTVLVMPGTYYENINFKGKNILVTSNFIFDHNDSTILKTIIDGGNKASVVTFNSGEESTACIHGFTITHGCHYKGGGIFCNKSSPRIAYNVISENVADPGCIEPGWDVMLGGTGGGIYCFNSTSIVEHNSIINNQCTGGQEGGGSGGGIIFDEASSLIIRYNLIASNSVFGRSYYLPPDPEGGGGIFGRGAALIYSNTIVNNSSSQSGGGIFITGSSVVSIYNNTIVNNSADWGGGGICSWIMIGLPVVSFNDIFGNTGNFSGFSTEVGDTTWGFNRNGVPCDSFHNIIRDPLFVNVGNSDFNLLVNSPCIDAGDPRSPMDPDSTIADIGAFYYPHTPTLVKDDERNLPHGFELSQNYPNPFNPITTIPYRVASGQWSAGRNIHTALKVYNILGQLVRTLVDEEKTPGNYDVTWDGKDNSGKQVASGTYFYQLKTKDVTVTKKMILLR